jgi:hypothetical protein
MKFAMLATDVFGHLTPGSDGYTTHYLFRGPVVYGWACHWVGWLPHTRRCEHSQGTPWTALAPPIGRDE